MNYWISVAAIAVLILFVMLSRRRFREHMRRFEKVDQTGVRYYLNMLLERGANGAFMIFDDMASNRFIQFRKYIKYRERIGIECHFPQAPWSDPYYGAFQEGISFEEATGSGQPVSKFVRVDFGRDIDSACQLLEAVFIKLFGLPEVSVRVRSHGINSKDQVIDR